MCRILVCFLKLFYVVVKVLTELGDVYFYWSFFFSLIWVCHFFTVYRNLQSFILVLGIQFLTRRRRDNKFYSFHCPMSSFYSSFFLRSLYSSFYFSLLSIILFIPPSPVFLLFFLFLFLPSFLFCVFLFTRLSLSVQKFCLYSPSISPP